MANAIKTRLLYHAYLAFRKAKLRLKLLNLSDAFCVDKREAKGAV